ncbi:hypothetical protein ACJMK2_036708 [Sinanodonta woodiana]|uniref:Uncharacterized protein n=1 Tax=Sinanodonta woodiana TaxID=1069815 RepID=A0ABD3WIE8_SINWO
MMYFVIQTTCIYHSKMTGPSFVFDGQRDFELVSFLRHLPGVTFDGIRITGQPVVLLNGAEAKGYRVISTVVKGETIIWTLHK